MQYEGAVIFGLPSHEVDSFCEWFAERDAQFFPSCLAVNSSRPARFIRYPPLGNLEPKLMRAVARPSGTRPMLNCRDIPTFHYPRPLPLKCLSPTLYYSNRSTHETSSLLIPLASEIVARCPKCKQDPKPETKLASAPGPTGGPE